MGDTTTPIAAPAAEPAVVQAQPAQAAVQPAQTAPAATTPAATDPAAPIAPESLGSEQNPIIVPRGTQEAFSKIAEGGYKQEEIDAYLATITDDGLKQNLKDALEGKQIHLKEGILSIDDVDPFDPEELKDHEALVKDPELLAARIEKMHKEYLALAEEAEKNKNAIPEPMQRIMQHPLVKLAVDEMEAGQDFSLQYFDANTFNSLAERALASGNPEEIKTLLDQVPETMNEILKIAIAKTREDVVQEQQNQIAQERAKIELENGLTKAAMLPEFKTSEPEMVNGQPNLNHPGVAFGDWLIKGLASGALTLSAIEYQGGFEKMAMAWLAERRGGTGKMIHEARTQAAQSWRDKMLASRQKALIPGQASTLSIPTGGVQRALVHGVDLDLALKDSRYAESVTRSLSNSQLAEVTKALEARAGIQ